MEREGILNEFLKRYLEDREHGPVRTLKDYQAQFPGNESQIAEEYARLSLPVMRGNGAQDSGAGIVGSQLGDFRILREIGRGGMGVVYLAEQVSLCRKVALKVLPAHLTLTERQVERFRREANAAAKLQHPGVAAIYWVGAERNTHFFAMEYIDGGSLHQALEVARQHRRTTGSTTPERLNLLKEKSHVAEAAEIVAQVAEALAYAHSQGIIHRDIKPQNILIDVGGKPRLVDFGLAKDVQQESLSVSGELVGTPNYMSPEQVTAKRIKIDHRTDVFSLGVVLYEILTLERPFRGDTAQQVLYEITSKEPRSLRGLNRRVPRDLETICLKALEKDPDRRYAHAASMAEDLRRFLRLEPIVAKPSGPITRTWKWTRRHRSFTAATVLILMLGLVLVAVRAWQIRTWRLRFERAVKDAELCASGGRLEEALASILEALSVRPDDAVAKSRYETYRTSLELRAVQSERDLKDEALQETKRLSDVVLIRDHEKLAETLWPRHPDKIPEMRKWLGVARELESRLPMYEEILLQVKQRANLSEGTAGLIPEGTIREPDWEKADPDLRFRFETSRELVTRIRALAQVIADVESRIEFAEAIHRRSIGEYTKDWDEAINEIAFSEKYGELEITAQMGLVPMGPDPESGLWEFWHVETGARPPRDEKTQKLILTEEMGLVLVLIPGGTFTMGAVRPTAQRTLGSPNVDESAHSDEFPLHTITLDPFLLSKYEMTQGQWSRFTRHNPSWFQRGMGRGARRDEYSMLDPVENVTYEDCERELSRLGLVLPTEAQWEYAARAGTTTTFWCGNDKTVLSGVANLADQSNDGSYTNVVRFEAWNDQFPDVAPIGSFQPNPFGLHDVHGNLWEWCRDWYLSYDHAPAPGTGERMPAAEDAPADRVLRGGGWNLTAINVRSSYRRFNASLRSSDLGARPARVITE